MKTKVAAVMCPAWSLETPPLSLGLIAGSLKEKGRKCEQFHINLLSADHVDKETQEELWAPTGHFFWTNDHSFEDRIVPAYREYWDEIIDELATFDIVTFTVYFSNVVVTDYIAQRLYNRNPKVHILYGGPYCWNAPKGGLLVSRPDGEPPRHWIKVSCDMEGEIIINELIDAYEADEDYQSVKGVWTWNDFGRPIFTGMRVPTRDLTTIPKANWDGVDLDLYAKFHYEGHTHLPIQGSRGCTYKCTFCSETRVFRYRKGHDIAEEILEQVDKYGITHFSFVDSLVNGSMREFTILVDELCEAVDKNPKLKELSLGGYARTHNKMDMALMKKAAKAGFKWLSIGVESGTPKILEVIEKRQTVEQVATLWEACWHNGIRMDANWISGYPKENHIDWIISLYFLYKNKHYIPVVAANQFPAGVTPGTPLDVYRDVFNISPVGNIFYDWTSWDLKNTFVNRFLRLKLCHLFLYIWKIYFSGFWTVADGIKKFNVKNKDSIFNKDIFNEWKVKWNGTFWQQTHNRRQAPKEFDIKDIDYNVPYLEEMNIPWNDEYDPSLSIEDTIKIQTRNEIRVWCWLMHQLVGPYEIEMELDEDYSERNIDGARLISKFKWESNEDGSYKLEIDNKLTVDKRAKNTIYIQLPLEYKYSEKSVWSERRKQIMKKFKEDKDPVHEGAIHLVQTEEEKTIVSLYDISFHDEYVDEGNVNDEYEDKEHLQKTYGTPNYLDALDVDKYRINLKRTEMTGKY